MLVLISMPNAPSVRYNGFIYSTEADCQTAKYDLMEAYEDKPIEYKLMTSIDAYCVEFESFPTEGLRNDIKA